ncbi:hypothetical protein E2C01_026386 [Portunus trituberculatus]|uniref:Uncharacterized protein n=1 Tax=Portunus trituberculatus TaxID=210409 RepID=A0A5B7EIM0_PORTR|nr:hypothetical protein [Portunus trituberculatus]
MDFVRSTNTMGFQTDAGNLFFKDIVFVVIQDALLNVTAAASRCPVSGVYTPADFFRRCPKPSDTTLPPKGNRNSPQSDPFSGCTFVALQPSRPHHIPKIKTRKS